MPPFSGVSLAGGLLGRGFSFVGGVSLVGDLLGREGGSIPACTEADPPVDRITDTSKNVALATTSLRPVINLLVLRMTMSEDLLD